MPIIEYNPSITSFVGKSEIRKNALKVYKEGQNNDAANAHSAMHQFLPRMVTGPILEKCNFFEDFLNRALR